MGLRTSLAARLGLLVVLGFAAAVAVGAHLFPIFNWDILAYLASAYDAPNLNPEDVHSHAYETVRRAAPESEFLLLTGLGDGNSYRIRQYTDPDAFITMLSLYKVKWLYVQVVAWLSNFTDPLVAIRLISSVSSVALCVVAAGWLALRNALHLGPLAVASLILLGITGLARSGTPDVLSAALVVAGMLAVLHRVEVIAAPLLFAAFLVRPDNIVYIGMLAGVFIVMRSVSWGTVAALAAATVAYVPISNAPGYPGWWAHLWFTRVEYVETLEGFAPDFSPVVYLHSLAEATTRAAIGEPWPAVLVVGCAVWWQFVQNRIPITRRESAVLWTTLLAVAAKLLVFPVDHTRFYMGYVVVFCLVLLGAAGSVRWEPPWRSSALSANTG